MQAGPKLLLPAAVLLLSGCATPETRLKHALVEAGLSEALAGCMAGRMVDRLSMTQLYRMRDLKSAGRASSTDEFLHRVRSLRDSEIWIVTSTSAAVCGAGIAA